MPPAGGVRTSLSYRIKGGPPSGSFASAWGEFGPGTPLAPFAPEAVRVWDFPVGINTVIRPPAYEPFGFRELRAFANVELVRLAIETRKDQIEALDWRIKPKGSAMAVDDDTRVAPLEAFWRKPDGVTPFATWLRLALEHLLVLDAPIKDDFDEWLARIVAYAFSLPPTPFVRQMNKGAAGEDQDRGLEEGLEPIKLWVKRLIDGVIQDEQGGVNLEFVWNDAPSIDPAAQSGIDDTSLRNGSATIDEVRARRGQAPPPNGEGAKARVYGAQAIAFDASTTPSPPSASLPAMG